MRTLKTLVSLMLLAMIALPASAQENNTGNWFTSLLGEAPVNERLFYRVPLARDYEATVHGNRLQGIGHLEFEIISLDGNPLDADSTVILTATAEDNRLDSATYLASYQDGVFLFDDIVWTDEDVYNLTIRIDGTAYNLEVYVPPAKPDTNIGFISANLAIPVVFLLVILGMYRLFNVQFLPENRRQMAQAS